MRGLVLCYKWHKGGSRPSDCLKTPNLPGTTWKQRLSTGYPLMPTMCSPLEHTEYLLLQTDLLKQKVLGPFDQVCLHIFDIDIKVINYGYL